MKTILVCGNIFSELQLFVDKPASPNSVSFATKVNSITSSKVINAARVMSKNCKVILYGCVGTDQDAKKAISELLDYGFDIDLIKQIDGTSTGKVIIATDSKGQNSVYVYFGASDQINFEHIPAKIFGKVDAIYADTGNSMQFTNSLIKCSEENALPLFMDVPNRHNEFDQKSEYKIDFFMPNRFEAEKFLNFKIKTIEDAKTACTKIQSFVRGNILITLDKDGCVLLRNGSIEPEHFIVTQTKTIDSTGAGDIFRGIFTSEVVNGISIEQGISNAGHFASQSVKIKGVDKKIRNLIGQL